ncbi:hypothetical protein HPB51_028053 [Rhipicephalus microplus]|uniref:DDE Tnp4 domain-containing protein n=1 Tax=Rhipicephalus microplus TaxID=6941 RepID=A0A9J6CY89_RHIMP|nr:hypothetical protein HPB51_028053 [Rhipicephalus microplus]
MLLSQGMTNKQVELDTEYEDADLPAHAPETQRFHLKLQELLLLERKKLLSQMVSTRRWWTRPVWINRTQESFFHTVGTVSIVLVAVCDSDLKFVVVDVGAFGQQSNGGTLGMSRLAKCLKDGKLGLPPREIPPGTNTQAPHVFVGDDAFQLREDFLKPYSRRQLSSDKKIFNHSLSRAG